MKELLLCAAMLIFFSCSENYEIEFEQASHFVDDSTIALITVKKNYRDDYKMDLTYLSLETQEKATYRTLNTRDINAIFRASAYNAPYLCVQVYTNSNAGNTKIQKIDIENGDSHLIDGITPIYISASGRYFLYQGLEWEERIYDFKRNTSYQFESFEPLYITDSEEYVIGLRGGAYLCRYHITKEVYDTLRTYSKSDERNPRRMSDGMLFFSGTRYRQYIIEPSHYEAGNISQAKLLPQLWGNEYFGYEINTNRSLCIQLAHEEVKVYDYKNGVMLYESY